MLKRIRPKAKYSLEIDGKEVKGNYGVHVEETAEDEVTITIGEEKRRPRIKPRAEYSVEVNE